MTSRAKPIVHVREKHGGFPLISGSHLRSTFVQAMLETTFGVDCSTAFGVPLGTRARAIRIGGFGGMQPKTGDGRVRFVVWIGSIALLPVSQIS